MILSALRSDLPVDPNAPTAREWIIRELAKPEYQAAQPTWFDRLSSAVWGWLKSLNLGTNSLTQGPVLIAIVAVVLAAIVAAFLIFGPPRLGRRSGITGVLFGEDDERDSSAMRRAAESAAAGGDWALAIEEMFRAIARGLAERTIVSTSPGSTARDFAARTAAAMPASAEAVLAAAVAFDEVRYLGRDGTPAAYRQTAELEQQLRAARSPHQATTNTGALG
jgi:hypothetical protein